MTRLMAKRDDRSTNTGSRMLDGLNIIQEGEAEGLRTFYQWDGGGENQRLHSEVHMSDNQSWPQHIYTIAKKPHQSSASTKV